MWWWRGASREREKELSRSFCYHLILTGTAGISLRNHPPDYPEIPTPEGAYDTHKFHVQHRSLSHDIACVFLVILAPLLISTFAATIRPPQCDYNDPPRKFLTRNCYSRTHLYTPPPISPHKCVYGKFRLVINKSWWVVISMLPSFFFFLPRIIKLYSNLVAGVSAKFISFNLLYYTLRQLFGFSLLRYASYILMNGVRINQTSLLLPMWCNL